MTENGTIVTVGNPNRLVKYAIKHQNEDYFYHEDTGEIKRGGKMILGEPWYYITPDMYPVYENGVYVGEMIWDKMRYKQ